MWHKHTVDPSSEKLAGGTTLHLSASCANLPWYSDRACFHLGDIVEKNERKSKKRSFQSLYTCTPLYNDATSK